MDPLWLAISFASGCLLGLFYFGLLWQTVQRIPGSRNPALLVFGSFLVRIAMALTTFYFVMSGRWERILACLLGFLIVRQFLIARIRPRRDDRPVKEGGQPA